MKASGTPSLDYSTYIKQLTNRRSHETLLNQSCFVLLFECGDLLIEHESKGVSLDYQGFPSRSRGGIHGEQSLQMCQKLPIRVFYLIRTHLSDLIQSSSICKRLRVGCGILVHELVLGLRTTKNLV